MPLHGREQLLPEEIAQLYLLFGQENDIGARIGREMMDLRAVEEPGGGRWKERVESHANVLACLRTALEFLSRHVGVEGVTLDGLRATTGSADYIAIREALVNLFIHQDYTDASAPAQLEVSLERTVFFNTGYSLVGKEALLQGGKSQARNPLIARALRLIGFAELAGSGLRELQRAWRSAQRRPPRIESHEKANTFTLTLDWRMVPDTYDRIWKEKIGVKLTPDQATILNLAQDAQGVSPEEAASATGLDLSEAKAALRFLELQVLVKREKERFHLSEHLRELARGGSDAG